MARRVTDLVATELPCWQYKVVKTAILKVYDLVPEEYRQKFRGTAKSDNQTHVEFSRQKETMLERGVL